MSYTNREDLAAKAEWEGGVLALLEYGVKPSELPSGDRELREAWEELSASWAQTQRLAAQLEALLDLPG